MVTIYQISNDITSRSYIGSTKNFKARITKHFNNLKKGLHASVLMQEDYNLYGEYSFSFIAIEQCNDSDRYIREAFYIKELDTTTEGHGYNTAIPSEIGGNTYTAEVKKQFIINISKGTYKGMYPDSTEEDYNTYIQAKEAYNNRERFVSSKPVMLFNKDTGALLLEFPSLEATARYFGVESKVLSRVINLQHKSFKGYTIIHKSTYDENKVYKWKSSKIKKETQIKESTKRKIEVYVKETNEILREFNNTNEAAIYLETSVAYVGKLIRGEKGKLNAVGVRYKV